MRRGLGFVSWLVLSACAGLPRGPVLPETSFRLRELKLANGLRVIVEEDHATPLVGVFTVVGVGSSGDPAGRAGLAHLLEHLAFRAKPGGKDTAWNQLEGAGVGFLNASTSFDETVYMNVGTRDLLPKLLSIEVGRMVDPLNGVDQSVVDVEREVVRNELRQRGENAIGPALNFMQEAVFPEGHPYARPIGGSHESLSAITLDDVKKFALGNYRPDNMTLLIIGDVDLEHIEATLKQALPSPVFEPRQSRTSTPSRLAATGTEPPAPPQLLLAKKFATVPTPELWVVWSLPRGFDANDAVMLDFLSAQANQELSTASGDPDVVSVSAFAVPGAAASMLVVKATLRKGDHVERSLERVLDQVVKLWSGGVGRDDGADDAQLVMANEYVFSRMRNQAAVQLTVEAESLMTRGVSRVTAAHFTGDPLTYGRQLKALAEISPAQVSTFAAKYLPRARARAVLVSPYVANDQAVVAGPAGLAPAQTLPMSTPLSPERVRELGRAHMAHAKLETVVSAKREHIEETLPNGLKVVVHKRPHALPVAAVELTFTRGNGGAEPKGATQLGEYLAEPRSHAYRGSFGISWSSSISLDRSRVMATGSAGNVPNMLAHLSERVTSMHVDTLMLSTFRTDAADALEAVDELPALKGERALQQALFRGHPWGVTSALKDARSLSSGDVDGWYERAWSPDNAVLVVTGDLDAEATFLEVKKWLGEWPRVKNPFPAAPPVTFREAPVELLVTHQPNATQAQVTLACLADGSTFERSLANQLLASVLGTALFEKIRGELGASYGFSGFSGQLVGGVSDVEWQGSIENSRLTAAMGVMGKLMRDFGKDTLTDRALERARWDVARQSTMAGSTSPSTAETFTRRVLAGHQTTEEDVALFDSLAALSREDLLAAWKQCHGHMVMSVVGDEETVRFATQSTSF